MNTIDHTSLMVSFSMFGDNSNWPNFICGNLDFNLKLIAFYQEFKRLPTEDELDSEWTISAISIIKNNLRNFIQQKINHFAAEEARIEKNENFRKHLEQQKSLKKIASNMKKNNSPDPMGTIKEIAERNGISISEVRKMKKDGRLSELN